MHRKSLEAAEALKNDDSGNSDREDEQSKASDISSTGNPNSKSMASKQKPNGSCSVTSPTNLTSNAANHETMSSRLSVTPTSSTGQPSHVTSSPVSASTISTTGATTSPPPPQLPVHHLGILESKSMMSSPTHPNFHHDGDPEAFRWVDYNRDPISFIRCDFQFITIQCCLIANL